MDFKNLIKKRKNIDKLKLNLIKYNLLIHFNKINLIEQFETQFMNCSKQENWFNVKYYLTLSITLPDNFNLEFDKVFKTTKSLSSFLEEQIKEYLLKYIKNIEILRINFDSFIDKSKYIFLLNIKQKRFSCII